VVFVYAFKAILNRALTAIPLFAIGLLACANRGMHAPGDGGAAGTVAAGGRGGAAPGGTGGGPTGTAGMGGTGNGGNCNVAADAGAGGGASGACGAMFNFEAGLQGATINGPSTGFKSVAQSGSFTFCGSGALAITAMFSGATGMGVKGEVVLNLPGAPLDLTNKTITVHVAADPGCSSDLYLAVVLNTQAGPIYFSPPFQVRPITNVWKTATATVQADAGSTSALYLSLQAFSSTGYQGTIYVDEIDIR
jgi:hypothetical protein